MGQLRNLKLAVLCAGLAACVEIPGTEAPVVEQPAPAVVAPPPTIARPTSPESAALRASFAQIQSAQLTLGLLRRDGGGPDTPYTPTMLTRNFIDIAFFNEYDAPGLRSSGAGTLRRWDGPVRIGLEFGRSVPPSQRKNDARDVENYAARLSRVTGHPISVGGAPNFIVAFLSEDDRTESLPRIAARLPGLEARDLAPLTNLPDDIYCLVIAYPSETNPSAYVSAVAIIRAENPDLLRLSCIHEEVAQGLGLANDSPTARPSIFNDDDEFALLTSHDEHLLSMLYSDRLMTGANIETSRPILMQLATNALEPSG